MKYKLVLKSKFLLYQLFGLFILLLILGVSVISNRFIETSITIVLFFIYRSLYDKQYHSKSLFTCGIISLIIFTIVSNIELRLSLSLISSVILTFLITTLSFVIREHFDRKQNKTDVKKRLENLTLDEMIELMPNFKIDILTIVYEYLHREKSITAYSFARSKNISEPSVYKYVKKVRDFYKSL